MAVQQVIILFIASITVAVGNINDTVGIAAVTANSDVTNSTLDLCIDTTNSTCDPKPQGGAWYDPVEAEKAAILNDPRRPLCPESYIQDDNPKSLQLMCRARSCANVTPKPEVRTGQDYINSTLLANSSLLMVTVTMPITKRECKGFSPTFTNCIKTMLQEGDYAMDNSSGEAVILRDNSRLPLGNYFRQRGTLLVCANQNASNETSTKQAEVGSYDLTTPQWCTSFPVPEGEYTIAPNGILTLNSIKIDGLSSRYYFRSTDANGTSTMIVCAKINWNFLKCPFIVIKPPGFRVQSDMRLWTLKDGHEQSYALGDYILVRDGSKATVCLNPKPKFKALVPYGVMASISCFFLLLTLLAHVWIPDLNHNCKPLICLLVSLLGFYLGLAISKLGGPFQSSTIDYALFSLRSIMGLASFFWLNVQSFDMWYGFANLISGASSRGSRRGDKRRFFIKCGYAWGIPLLMCIITLSINASESAQQALNMQLHLGEIGWFHDVKTIFVFFYAPIAIILVENVIFFALTIVNIRKASKGTDILNKRVSRQLLVVFAKLFVVMGICWFFEIISFAFAQKTSDEAWFFTDFVNLSQGVFIFFVYVFKRTTLKIIRAKLGFPMENTSQVTKSTSSSHQESRKTSVASAGAQTRKTPAVELTKVAVSATQNGEEHVDCQTKC